MKLYSPVLYDKIISVISWDGARGTDRFQYSPSLHSCYRAS